MTLITRDTYESVSRTVFLNFLVYYLSFLETLSETKNVYWFSHDARFFYIYHNVITMTASVMLRFLTLTIGVRTRMVLLYLFPVTHFDGLNVGECYEFCFRCHRIRYFSYDILPRKWYARKSVAFKMKKMFAKVVDKYNRGIVVKAARTLYVLFGVENKASRIANIMGFINPT